MLRSCAVAPPIHTSFSGNGPQRGTTEAISFLRQQMKIAGIAPKFHTAVILGSGLGRSRTDLPHQTVTTVPYAGIPGMAVPATAGHPGQLLMSDAYPSGCLFLQGRSHIYEGRTLEDVTWSVRILLDLGVTRLVLTNAAGGICSDLAPGSLMLIRDHLSFVDLHSLWKGTQLGEACRKPVWDEEYLRLACAISTPLVVHSGVYAMMPGPNYETAAEVRMLRRLGADAVGMSTVAEAIVGRQLGMCVLGVSCITNPAAGTGTKPPDHTEVTATASRIERDFAAWMDKLLKAICAKDGCRQA